MTMRFEISPHDGIGPVKLGMSSADVRNALGEDNLSSSKERIEKYFDRAIDVEFIDGCVSFIGVGFHQSYELSYKGINPFDVSALELFEIIAGHESSTHTYNEYEYRFPDQLITLWNAHRQYGKPGEEDRVIWAQIGIGSGECLDAIAMSEVGC